MLPMGSVDQNCNKCTQTGCDSIFFRLADWKTFQIAGNRDDKSLMALMRVDQA